MMYSVSNFGRLVLGSGRVDAGIIFKKLKLPEDPPQQRGKEVWKRIKNSNDSLIPVDPIKPRRSELSAVSKPIFATKYSFCSVFFFFEARISNEESDHQKGWAKKEKHQRKTRERRKDKKLEVFFAEIEFWAVQEFVNLVDLENRCKMSI